MAIANELLNTFLRALKITHFSCVLSAVLCTFSIYVIHFKPSAMFLMETFKRQTLGLCWTYCN